MARGVRGPKWVSILSDIHPREHPIYDLSDAAYRLYVGALCYATNHGINELPPGVVRMILGRRSRKAVAELLEGGWWTEGPTKRFREGNAYFIQHEGSYWRRGRVEQRKPIPTQVRALVMERDGYACVICQATEWLALDHIFPYSKGGSDEPENLRVLCRVCNSQKGARA